MKTTSILEGMYMGSYDIRVTKRADIPQKVRDDLLFCPDCKRVFRWYKAYSKAKPKIDYFPEFKNLNFEEVQCGCK